MKIGNITENKAAAHEDHGHPQSLETAETDRPCVLVGVGASAGGHTALELLFSSIPADCDVSFLVIMHLPSDGPSFLAGMLSRFTRMKVLTAEEGMAIRPNSVYVIPSGKNLKVKDGRLHLEIPEPGHNAHYPIDCLFNSLAEQAEEEIVAVILSGSGNDGFEGAKTIKAAGGIIIAQEPDSAEYPAMPKSVIDTEIADLILPVNEIAIKIAEISQSYCPVPRRSYLINSVDDNLAIVLSLVKEATGNDFSSYKTNTIVRRIERRMAMNDIAEIGKYITMLRNYPQEAHSLCQDILIGVTGFFRDPEAFATIRREVLPILLINRDATEPLRVWHPCCSTGEEAYSMAMLIKEYLNEHKLDRKVMIFATDIDESAIAQARAGIYDGNIEADVGEERLKTYFTGGSDHWQVIKPLKEMIVFAPQSLIKDPPFSRLDLLVCRNFLIYLTSDMQKRLISLFHQALKPGGILFLGSSETVGRASDLFSTIDKKWKIFRRLKGEHRSETPFPYPASIRRFSGAGRFSRPAEILEPSLGEIAEKVLLDRYSPPCVVVDEKYEIIYISTRTGGVLEDPIGEPTTNILRKAKEPLRPALRAAIHNAFAEQKKVEFRCIKIVENGLETSINLVVEPLNTSLTTMKLAMVIFEPVALPAELSKEDPQSGEASSKDVLIGQLEEQLRVISEQLRTTTEQLESTNEGYLSANEELMSINEEFHSANEELQSTNEELETSKEELLALNEELITLNAELHEKVEELNQANNDIENLLTSSEIATLFLDRHLNIKGFTPAAAAIFNLIPTDIKRPFRHFAGKIDWSNFIKDTETVLAGQAFTEREVTTLDSELCYLKRIFPYRNRQGEIDGIVTTLVDITQRKRDEAARSHLAAIVESSEDAIIAKDLNGIIRSWNTAAEEMFGYQEKEVIGQPVTQLIPQEMHAEEAEILQKLSAGEHIAHYETIRIAKDGRQIEVSMSVSPIKDSKGRIIGSSKIARDISERKRTEEALRQSQFQNEFLAKVIENSSQPFGVGYADGRIGLINKAFERLTGYSQDELNTLDWNNTLTPPEWREIERQNLENLLSNDQSVRYEKEYIKKDGSRVPIELLVHLATDIKRNAKYYYSFITDITKRKQAEKAIRDSEERWRFALLVGNFGAWEMNLTTRNTWRTPSHDEIFGYPEPLQEWSYETFLQHILAEDRDEVNRYFLHATAEHQDMSFECRIRRTDNQVRWIWVQSKYHNNESVFGLVGDITERKLAQQALVDADRRKDEFLAMLAHELRNPMTPILNAVQILKHTNSDLNRISWCSDVIYRQVEHLIRLVDDLLDVSRFNRGLIELKKEPLEIREFIMPAVETNQPLIDARRQKLSMTIPSEPLWVEGDRVRLAQVISNLLNNAAKYTEEAGHIALFVEPTDTDICIHVNDSGCGIDPASLRNLFDLFYQADRNLDRSQGGLGIGLSLVHSLVDRHGGYVQAFSPGLGKGSEFVVRLPRITPPKTSTIFTGKLNIPDLTKLRILVVDDNCDIAESLALLLELDGHQVQIANNGPAALEMAQSAQPDVILLDIGLPEMDGYTVAKAIQSIPNLKRPLLISLTGYGQPEDLKRSADAGFDEHLIKPVDFEIIKTLLAKYKG